jgi:hypothetical protein
MATHEAAHGIDCEFSGGGCDRLAAHYVFAQFKDLCEFHSPYDALPTTDEDTLTDEEMDPDYPEYIESATVQYAPGFVFVNVYELDQVFGGPEEGGWWVTTYRVVTSRQVPAGSAESTKATLEAEYPTAAQVNEHNYLLSLAGEWTRRQYRYTDVNYAGGDYRVHIEDKPGVDLPVEWPHYE